MACSLINVAKPFRLSFDNCFESFRPTSASQFVGKITAAVTTGPASGPLPASSTPAINVSVPQ